MNPPEKRLSKHSIRAKVILGFGSALLIFIIIAFTMYGSTNAFLRTAQWVAHTREVLRTENALVEHLTESESSARAYLLTGQERYLEPYARTEADAIHEFKNLKVMTADSPAQQQRLNYIQPLISEFFGVLKQSIDMRRNEGLARAAAAFADDAGENTVRRLKTILAAFDRTEQDVLLQRAEMTRSIGEATTFAILLGSLLTVVYLVSAGLLILRDISARRRAEEALAEERNLLGSLIDAMPDRVYVKDLEGRYIINNAAHRQHLRATFPDDPEGKTVHDLYPKEKASQYAGEDERVLSTGQSMFNREETVMNEKGEVAWSSTTKVPLRDTDGRVVGLVCVSSDISERKEAEEQLRLFAAQLERSNSELADFASVASHDLQEPLRKIQAFGDRLRTKCATSLGEAGIDYLDRILNAAKRMQTLIHDLLTLSRVTSRALPFKQVNLREVLTGVLSDLELRIEQSGATIEIGELPEIEADELQMRQLFQNLISNALKFQKADGAPEVSVSAKVLELQEPNSTGISPGDSVCQIRFTDNGIGFNEQYAERIFAVFQRLHSRSEYEGTGIGLAVCRKITDRHGGTIVAKGVEGEGATFIVTLPLKQRMKETHD